MTSASQKIEFGFVACAAGAPGTSDGDMYSGFLSDCELYGELGYKNVWLLEHHFSDYYPTPDPMLLMAHLAGRFPQFNYGTCVLVTPWHNPLRLAGQIAMVSQLTNSQLHLGLGRGTAKYEYDAFGIDMGEGRARFKEIYEVLDLAVRGESFTYEGEFIHVPKVVRIRPEPKLDQIHFYGAIGNPESASVMAKLGLTPICTSIGNLELQAATIETWRQETAGDTTDVTLPIMIDCIVSDTDEEAIAEACELKPRYMQAQLDHYTPHVTDWENTPGYEAWKKIFAGMEARTKPEGIVPWTEWQLIGSPETVTRKLQSFIDAGFNHIILQFSTPGVPLETRQRWATAFAKEVAPAFTSDLEP